MKVITIKEPFASLIANNIKHIETRSWKTNYRGKIYIHSSKVGHNLKGRDELKELVKSIKTNPSHILCKCILKDCIYMDEEFINKIKNNHIEYICGHYEVGRYAWILDNVELITPIEAKGKLGIWNYEDK